MSDDEPREVSSQHAGTDRAVPPPPPPVASPPRPIDRVGRLTAGWRVVMAVTWVAVAAAWAGVWNASVQVGLSTWWLGPRGDPQPAVVRLLPFLIAGTVVIVTLNRVRFAPWIGLAAAACLGAIAVGDIGRVDRLALVEGAIAVAAALVSAVALTGRVRAAG